MRYFVFISVLTFAAAAAAAQTIRVNPTGVNVNSQNPTTVFLTFGQIPPGYQATEAVWCGQLTPAPPPSLGLQCLPGTIYGVLPSRYNLSQTSGNLGLTDIMSIPSSVVRRAFQAGASGSSAGFFYVRRFVSTSGQPDQFVAVTCRMARGGARSPFALTDVEFIVPSKEPIIFLKRGQKLPVKGVDISYNGTGRLKGRWELVLPGEELPSDNDLLTEATLPIENRASQRRYAQVERFDYFLPPTGKFRLEIKNIDRLPINTDGQYLLLLRIEAVDDKEGDSNLAAIGVGTEVVHSGAVAGFPMPAFKFFVTGDPEGEWAKAALLAPAPESAIRTGETLVFGWRQLADAAYYRIDFNVEGSDPLFQAILPAGKSAYRAPSWFFDRFVGKTINWRVVALDDKGRKLAESSPRSVTFQ
ncbi:MAG: hypothetical protein ACT4O9_09335 [Blastocatellia bacterium]